MYPEQVYPCWQVVVPGQVACPVQVGRMQVMPQVAAPSQVVVPSHV